MRERVDILNVTAPYNIVGVGTEISMHASGLRAKVELLPGGLNEATQQAQFARQPLNVWIRYRAGVTAFQQVRWRDHDDAVRMCVMTGPPEEIVRKRWLLLHCEAVTIRDLP